MLKKAIITAAGKGTRQYPATNAVQKELFPLVDLDGITKPTIQIIIEQVLNAGIEEIAIIVQPGEEKQFKTHFQELSDSDSAAFQNKSWGLKQSELLKKMRHTITYIHQTEQHGFGHAVYCAKEWVDNDPVLLLLGDHIFLSHVENSCVQQVVEFYERFKKSIFAVQQTSSDELYLFGTVGGALVDSRYGIYDLDRIAEKPSPEYATTHLAIQELPPHIFLTIFGIYALSPTVFEILEEHVRANKRSGGEIQLTSALDELLKSEGGIGLEVAGERLDMGNPLGYLHTQLALALHGPFADPLKSKLHGYLKRQS